MKARAAVLLVVLAAGACSRGAQDPSAAPNASAPALKSTPQPSATQAPAPELAALPDPGLRDELRAKVEEPFTGDFDGMVARRLIRVGTTFNRTFYFVDNGTQRGFAYEYLLLYEQGLNKKLNTGTLPISVVPLAMPRDALLPALQAGKVDMVVAQLTVTPERERLVDFTHPTRKNVDEVVVTGPGAPPISSLEDLSGREVFVRKTSSYYGHLVDLNKTLASRHKTPVQIELASESLEDDDLLEMVNAGLIPAIVVDSYLADFWKQVFTSVTVHANVALKIGGHLAVAMRKNSPKLAENLNAFIDKQGLDSTVGAVLNKRYLQNINYVRNARSDEERKKFLALVEMFRKYGKKYDFDYVMMAAQGYQESRLDHNAKSSVGAIGVMQLMPQTGREQKVGDITKVEPNVHAGVKYMRFLRREFFDQEPMDELNKALFTFAAYNAGPGRIRQLRREAAERKLNPNVWFGSVERVASERIGRETVTYVGNIYKYYVAYRLVLAESERRKAAVSATRGNGSR